MNPDWTHSGGWKLKSRTWLKWLLGRKQSCSWSSFRKNSWQTLLHRLSPPPKGILTSCSLSQKDHCTLNKSTGDFIIRNVTREHGGCYRAEVNGRVGDGAEIRVVCRWRIDDWSLDALVCFSSDFKYFCSDQPRSPDRPWPQAATLRRPPVFWPVKATLRTTDQSASSCQLMTWRWWDEGHWP